MKNLINKLKNRKVLKRLGIVFIIVLIIGGVWFYEKYSGRVQIDNSLIEAPIISVTPSSPGKLEELDVHEGQTVQKGDLLAIVGTEALRADSYGLVISAPDEIGGTVGLQAPVIQLVNVPDMRVDGTLDETKGLDQVKVGQVVSFTVDALPGKTFWGYVDEVAPSAKQTALSFSISSERPTQQFEIYARYDVSRYPEIKNGMSAKMTVYTNTN